MTTNVPPIVFTPTGLVLPAESAILAGVLADENAAFGGDMSTLLASPQGQLAQSLTAIIGDKNNQIANIVNQIDPNTAAGRWQDAIGQLYFMTRIAAAGSVVTGRCVGLVGSLIPAGSLAQDAAGYLWASQADATISPYGSVDVSFQCQTTGPIACAIGSLSTIYKAITGWESITNPAAAVLGTAVESRADFEFRRKNSVASNAKGSTASILGSVLAVPNVLDAYVIDNPTNAAMLVGATNYSVAPHSVYIAVVGGAAVDVAKAIWVKKDLGCDYNGNTSAVVIDTDNTGEPQYTVTWETPAALPVFIKVNLSAKEGLNSST